ncbi:hypothetical protein BDQ17DRAFT_1322310 [Cyathus striatus]|nr:hypothetical protein BDQ17DRAFT_1322310 [Cyathus striatus]
MSFNDEGNKWDVCPAGIKPPPGSLPHHNLRPEDDYACHDGICQDPHYSEIMLSGSTSLSWDQRLRRARESSRSLWAIKLCEPGSFIPTLLMLALYFFPSHLSRLVISCIPEPYHIVGRHLVTIYTGLASSKCLSNTALSSSFVFSTLKTWGPAYKAIGVPGGIGVLYHRVTADPFTSYKFELHLGGSLTKLKILIALKAYHIGRFSPSSDWRNSNGPWSAFCLLYVFNSPCKARVYYVYVQWVKQYSVATGCRTPQEGRYVLARWVNKVNIEGFVLKFLMVRPSLGLAKDVHKQHKVVQGNDEPAFQAATEIN